MEERIKTCLWLICSNISNKSSQNTKNNSQIQLDSLLTHVAKSIEAPNPSFDLSSVRDFLVEFIPQWNQHSENVHPRITTFILKLISTVSKNEPLFLDLHKNKIYDIVFTKYDLLLENNPSIKLALVNNLISLSEHGLGIDWIVEKNFCSHIIEQCLQNRTIYFEREGRKFLTNFVWQLFKANRSEDCEKVLELIMNPIDNHRWKSATIISEEENSQMEAALLPTLNILIEIMSNVKYYNGANVILDVVSKNYNTEWYLCNLTLLSRSPLLLTALSNLSFLCRIAKINFKEDKFRKEDLAEMRLIHIQIMSTLISKRNIETILNFSYFTFTFLCQARQEYNLSFIIQKETDSIEFTDQIIILCILPAMSTMKFIKTTFVELFTEKLIGMLCEYTTRVAYLYRDLIKEKNNHQDIIKTIQRTVIYKKYFSKSQAVIIFQALYYKLQEYNPQFLQEENDPNYVLHNSADSWEAKNIISNILDCIYVFIDEFDIVWKDSTEVLCVLNYCIRIINTNLDPMLTVKAFKLAQLTIKKFLSPNLALLVNTAENSVISEIGKDIYCKLHDPLWDVRDSALELLYLITDLSRIKFPPFQQQLIDNALPELVMTIATEDSELYVRSSALKCISLMVRIKSIWEKHLQYLNLVNKMMTVLQEESEGLVRKEAALVMTNIYEYQKLPEASLDNVFLIMFHASVYDLHWEVQLAALNFWKLVIANQKSHQGMIDGAFPSVTFSKEHRKIVHLNEFEIHKRIKKILNELALRGCLGVLLTCMREDNDLEVKEGALLIIDDINNLLTNYNVTDLCTIKDSNAPSLKDIFTETFLKNHANISNIGKLRNKADIRNESNNIVLNQDKDPSSESVIDSIVNADDFNLLANVYENQLKVDNDSSPKKSEVFMFKGDHKYMSDMFVEPQTFLHVIRSTDFRGNINESRRWQLNLTDSVDSLFDDIISANRQSEVNDLDCY